MNYLKTLTFLFCLFATGPFFAQNQLEQSLSVRADGAAPNASAILDVQATDKGMLTPRMTTAERMAINSPATGLLVFDTDENSFFYFENAEWQRLGLPTDGDLDEVLKSDASGQASWQPLFSPEFIPDPEPSPSGSLGLGASPQSVAVQGSFAYVVGSGNNNFMAINVADPLHPAISGSIDLVLGPGTNVQSVAVQGNFAYVVELSSRDLMVIDVSDPTNPSLSGSIDIGFIPKDMAVQGSFAYVVDEGDRDFKVIDVSDPTNPALSGSIGIDNLPESVGVQGSFAYVVDSDSDDLKVIDVSDPTDPSLIGSVAIGSSPQSVAVQGSFAYVVDSDSDDLKVIDVSDPTDPSLIGSVAIGTSPQSVVVQDGFAYVVDSGSDDLKVIDVSDPANPTFGSSLAIGSFPIGVAVQGSFAYVVDDASNELKVVQLGAAAVGMNLTGDLVTIPSTWAGSVDLYNTNSGNVGIGTSTPASKLTVVDSAQNTITIQTTDNTLSNGLAFQNSGDNYTWNIFREDASSGNAHLVISGGNSRNDITALSERLRITASGNLGIGTDTPSEKVETQGNLLIRNPQNNGALILSPSVNGYETDPELVIQSAENLNGDDAHFHISRNAKYQTSDNSYQYIDDAGEPASKIEFRNNGDINFGSAPAGTGEAIFSNWFRITSTGNIFAPALPFGDHENMQYESSTGQFFYDNSSRRFKENIQPLEDDFSLILQAQPKAYTRPGTPGRWEVGYIAEEMDSLGLTKLVSYDGEGIPGGFNYEKMILYVTEVLKMQQGKLLDKEQEITDLKQSHDQMKQELTALKKQMARLEAALFQTNKSINED